MNFNSYNSPSSCWNVNLSKLWAGITLSVNFLICNKQLRTHDHAFESNVAKFHVWQLQKQEYMISLSFFYLLLPGGAIRNPVVQLLCGHFFWPRLVHWTLILTSRKIDAESKIWVVCSVLWVTDEIICISFKPAVAKSLPQPLKYIGLGYKIAVKEHLLICLARKLWKAWELGDLSSRGFCRCSSVNANFFNFRCFYNNNNLLLGKLLQNSRGAVWPQSSRGTEFRND